MVLDPTTMPDCLTGYGSCPRFLAAPPPIADTDINVACSPAARDSRTVRRIQPSALPHQPDWPPFAFHAVPEPQRIPARRAGPRQHFASALFYSPSRKKR